MTICRINKTESPETVIVRILAISSRTSAITAGFVELGVADLAEEFDQRSGGTALRAIGGRWPWIPGFRFECCDVGHGSKIGNGVCRAEAGR
jgi:hypothetical protein